MNKDKEWFMEIDYKTQTASRKTKQSNQEKSLPSHQKMVISNTFARLKTKQTCFFFAGLFGIAIIFTHHEWDASQGSCIFQSFMKLPILISKCRCPMLSRFPRSTFPKAACIGSGSIGSFWKLFGSVALIDMHHPHRAFRIPSSDFSPPSIIPIISYFSRRHTNLP